jgi:hypothetical protein
VSARTLVAAAAVASAALVAAYAALGGGRFEQAATGDPCAEREPSREQLAELLTLAAVDGAACALHTSREQVVLALASSSERAELARELGLSDARVEQALRAGLLRAIDEAVRADALDGRAAALLRSAARLLPLDLVLEGLERLT